MSDKKSKLIISKGIRYKTLLLKSFETLGGIESVIKEDDTVFIKIDLAFPEGYPSIVNPNILKNLVEICLSASPRKIFIGGTNFCGISTEFIWKSFGFSDIFEGDVVEFVSLDSKEVNKEIITINDTDHYFPEVVMKSDVYISLVNPRLNPSFDMELSIYNSLSTNTISASYINFERDEAFQNIDYADILENTCEKLIEYHSIKKPDIVLIDFNRILSTPGTQFFSDSYSINPNITILSNNCFLADYVVLKISGFEPKNNPLIKTIEKLEGDIIESSNVETIQFLDQIIMNSDEIKEINFTKPFLKHHKEYFHSHDNLKDNSIGELIEKDTNFPVIKNLPKIPEENEIFTSKAAICKGKICFGCQNAVYDLIYYLKSVFLKDLENLDGFSILFGRNPPEPKSMNNIIIIGNCAINSTRNCDFRRINITKTSKSDEDYNIELVRFEADIRNKRLEWEQQKAKILENLKLEISDEDQKQSTIESLEKKDKKLNNKMDKKIKKYREKQEIARSKYIDRKEKEDSKENKSVLEIQGCPPNLLLYKSNLANLFKKKWFPTLNMYDSYTKKVLTHNLILDMTNGNQKS